MTRLQSAGHLSSGSGGVPLSPSAAAMDPQQQHADAALGEARRRGLGDLAAFPDEVVCYLLHSLDVRTLLQVRQSHACCCSCCCFCCWLPVEIFSSLSLA